MSEERKCKVISVSNQKGGTAKTVSCVNGNAITFKKEFPLTVQVNTEC